MKKGFCVECIRSLEDLERHAVAWDKLAARLPFSMPLASHSWISTFLQYRLAPDEQWCCLIAYDDDELVGVLTLIVAQAIILGFSRKIIHSPRDSHTLSIDALVAPEQEEQEVVESLLSTLAEVEPKWHRAYFQRISTSSPLINQLNNNSKGKFVFHETASIGAYLPTTRDFETYRSGLKKSFKSRFNTSANRLNRCKNVCFEFLSGEQATEADFERFTKVEAQSWKGRIGSAIEKSQELIDFYLTLIKRLSKRGWLEWHFLMADGKTIAGNLAIKCGHSLFIWKLGYDEDYAKCSPGTILFDKEVQYAFESDQINMIDFVTDPPWVKNWNTQKRDFENLWVCPVGILPLLTDVLPKLCCNNMRKISFIRHMVQRFRSLADKANVRAKFKKPLL